MGTFGLLIVHVQLFLCISAPFSFDIQRNTDNYCKETSSFIVLQDGTTAIYISNNRCKYSHLLNIKVHTVLCKFSHCFKRF